MWLLVHVQITVDLRWCNLHGYHQTMHVRGLQPVHRNAGALIIITWQSHDLQARTPSVTIQLVLKTIHPREVWGDVIEDFPWFEGGGVESQATWSRGGSHMFLTCREKSALDGLEVRNATRSGGHLHYTKNNKRTVTDDPSHWIIERDLV